MEMTMTRKHSSSSALILEHRKNCVTAHLSLEAYLTLMVIGNQALLGHSLPHLTISASYLHGRQT